MTQNSNSHLLSLYISYIFSMRKFLKYLLNSSCSIIFFILFTTVFVKHRMILQGLSGISCSHILYSSGLFNVSKFIKFNSFYVNMIDNR